MRGIFYPVDSVNGSWDWTFGPFESRWFLFGLDERHLSPAPVRPGAVVTRLDTWTIRPVRRFDLKIRRIDQEFPDEKARPVKLGDWRKVLGEKFSGDAVYSARFTVRKDELARSAFLDLGTVKYAAQVCLNGQPAGSSMLSPFHFPVGDLLRRGVNQLDVTVTNTLANALSGEDTLDLWRKEFGRIGSFEDRERDFEQESLESGLFGPVTLRSVLK